MKKTITLLSTIGLMSSAMAQITVNSSDLVFPTGNDTAFFKVIDTATLGSVPQAANNTLWNYTAITATDSGYVNYLTSDGLHGFTTSTAMLNSQMPLGIATIENTLYYTQNANGFFTTGTFYEQQGFSIGASGDTLVVNGDTIDFGTDYPIINFPVSHNNSNVSNTSFQVNFMISYFPVYTAAPGYVKRTVNVTEFVSGWGQLVYPGSDDTLDAIRIQKTETFIDSFFINGTAVSNTILANFSLQQGETTTISTVELVSIGLQTPAMTINTNENFDVYITGRYHYVPVEDTTSNIATIQKSKLSFYPNPTNDNITVDLSGKNLKSNNVIAEIYGLDGRKIADKTLTNGSLSVKELSNAAYIVRIISGNEFVGYFRFVKE